MSSCSLDSTLISSFLKILLMFPCFHKPPFSHNPKSSLLMHQKCTFWINTGNNNNSVFVYFHTNLTWKWNLNLKIKFLMLSFKHCISVLTTEECFTAPCIFSHVLTHSFRPVNKTATSSKCFFLVQDIPSLLRISILS